MRTLLHLLFLALCTAPTLAAPVDEIEALLRYVGKLEGATFIRNGEAHNAADAEAHLRLKWGKQKSTIQTAEDFHPTLRDQIDDQRKAIHHSVCRWA